MAPTAKTPPVSLRPVTADDLPALYQIQLDPDANAMAAVKPRDRETFFAKLAAIMADPSICFRVIVERGAIVGSISWFKVESTDYIGYWIDRPHWGRGIATRAVALLLAEVNVRPLHARVAAHNEASLRVLLNNGFVITSREHSPETDRFLACEEVKLTLV